MNPHNAIGFGVFWKTQATQVVVVAVGAVDILIVRFVILGYCGYGVVLFLIVSPLLMTFNVLLLLILWKRCWQCGLLLLLFLFIDCCVVALCTLSVPICVVCFNAFVFGVPC